MVRMFYGNRKRHYQIDNQPCLENDDPEVRTHAFNIIVEPTQKPLILDRLNYFSDWTTVLRAIAHCLKYKENLRERASTNEKYAMENQPALAVIDLQKTKVEILKQIHKDAFSQELEDLSGSTRKTVDGDNRNDRHLRCTSPLYRLDPFLDEHYLLRFGGRLNKGSFCKMNIKKLKIIMSEKKTRLPSLRKQDRKTVKTETEKINELLTHIATNNITELNELIYGGVKLVCENISVSLKYMNWN